MLGELNRDGSSRKSVLIVSILFMGLGHLLYFRNYVKGVFYSSIEIIGIALTPFFSRKIFDLITLGSPQPDIPIKLRSNSMFMLVDGILILAVIAIFFVVYVLSIKSSLQEYDEYCIHGKFPQKSFRNIISEKAFPTAGLTPALLLLLFFVIVPLLFSAAVAFTNYSAPNHIPPNSTVDWVGVSNFVDIFGGSTSWTSAFGRVATWTLVWAVLATATCYIGGLVLAVVLHESNIKIKPFFRALFILPYAVPAIVSMLVWKNLLNGSFGIINRTLMEIGFIESPIPWLSDVWLARVMCVLVNLWAGFPYFMLLIMGNLTAISSDVYEAAKIDGASKFFAFRKITFPLVLFQTMPLIIMSFTHNINNFGAIYFLTGGFPKVADSTITSAGGTDILVTWIYNLTMTLNKYNYASVLAVVIFVIMAPFAILAFRQTKSYKEGEV